MIMQKGQFLDDLEKAPWHSLSKVEDMAPLAPWFLHPCLWPRFFFVFKHVISIDTVLGKR